MAEVNMPRLSDTMEEGTITRWLKKPGDQVQKGEVVAEVETDKANMEIESYTTGILEQILVQEGQSAPIGQPIAIVGDGSTTHAPQTQAVAPQNTSLAQNRQPQAANNHHDVAASISAPAPVESGLTQLTGARSQFKVSPLARRMAEEHNINLSELHGTGPGGRIVRDDIEDYLEQHETSHQPSTSSQESPNTDTTNCCRDDRTDGRRAHGQRRRDHYTLDDAKNHRTTLNRIKTNDSAFLYW